MLNQRPVSLNWIEHILVAYVKDWDDVQLLIGIFNYTITASFTMVTSIIHKEVDDFVVLSSISNAPKHFNKGLFSESIVLLRHSPDSMTATYSYRDCNTALILCTIKDLKVLTMVAP